MDEVTELEPDDKGGGEHGDGDHILHNDEQATQHHLRAITKAAFHDVDGLEAGNLPRRHDARDDAQQQDETEAGTNSVHADIFCQIYLSPEQLGSIVLETESQSQSDGEAECHHQRRLHNQLQRNLSLAAAEEPTRGHLLSTEPCIGHSQVDVVADGKEEDGEHGCQQDAQPGLVAFQQTIAVVLRGKHDVGEWSHRWFAVAPNAVVVLVDIFGCYFPRGSHIGAWLHHEKRLAGACSSAGI